MPVTKTAKRALRSSKVKRSVNNIIRSKLAVAIRLAEKNPTAINIRKAVSATDKAAKKNVLHKNKAARIKSRLANLIKTKSKKVKNS